MIYLIICMIVGFIVGIILMKIGDKFSYVFDDITQIIVLSVKELGNILK